MDVAATLRVKRRRRGREEIGLTDRYRKLVCIELEPDGRPDLFASRALSAQTKLGGKADRPTPSAFRNRPTRFATSTARPVLAVRSRDKLSFDCQHPRQLRRENGEVACRLSPASTGRTQDRNPPIPPSTPLPSSAFQTRPFCDCLTAPEPLRWEKNLWLRKQSASFARICRQLRLGARISMFEE